MAKKEYSDNIVWSDGRRIKIESLDHFNKLMDEGYEIKAKKFEYKHNLGSKCTLLMTKENDKLIANANSIFEYWANLVELYDFVKKKPMFVWVPDTSVYWEFEEALLMFPSSNHNIQPALKNSQIITVKTYGIYDSLLSWMYNERHRKYGITKLSEIFSLVCIREEKNRTITRRTVGKESVTLQQIDQIRSAASNLDNNIALSFFLLSKKLGPPDHFGDVLIGLILYDLKNEETLAFNIQSLTSFMQMHDVDKQEGLYDIAVHLFKRSISKELLCTSFVPLPLDSPWYTALPWLSYSTLLPIELDSSSKQKSLIRTISIPEFFTFGYSTDARYGNSFDFSYFSSDHDGRAVCILNLNEGTKILRYIMRFDQSQGERLIHIDFSYRDVTEFKLISHKPLDLEGVYKFNPKLFIAMMFAGIFDSYFNTLIKRGLKGIQKLAKRNPAFLYTLKWIWTIEAAISLVNETHGYNILEKLYQLQQLDAEEEELAKRMYIGGFSLVSEDENHNIDGLSVLGYIVLKRYNRKQTEIRVTH